MIQILFWVFLVLYAILRPWPGSPWSSWGWPGSILEVVLFVLLGIAVFGLRM